MKKRVFSLLIICALLAAFTAQAGAADFDAAFTGAGRDAAIIAADYPEVGGELEPEEALPSSYSAVDKGYVTPVRKQKYNTCWAYCSTATLESRILSMGDMTDHLSTMHMNYWGTTTPDGKGWQRVYYGGGFPYIALGYLTSFGAFNDSLFPEDMTEEDYRERGGDFYPHHIASSIIYLNANDRDTVKTAIYEYGGVIGNFHYDSAMSYNGAYYCDTPGLLTRQLYGHAIEIVGWDDAFSASSFNPDHQPSSDGAWLCKNSWGESFGNNGFFWISYEDNYLFDSRFGPSYAISEARPMNAIDKVQQNETYGAVCEFKYLNTKQRMTKMTYVNVFDFSDGYHNIDKVVFESVAQGSYYTVYYMPVDEDGVPVDDDSTWIELGSGTIGYEGYLSVNTGGFSAPEEKGAIGVQIRRPDSSGSLAIGTSEWFRVGGVMRFIPYSDKGLSYLIGYGVEPMDVMDFYSSIDDDIGGTFVIKALCHSDDENGDADRDGSFTIIDVTATQRELIDLMEFDKTQMRFADFDNNGEVDIVDCTKMQRRLVNLDYN